MLLPEESFIRSISVIWSGSRELTKLSKQHCKTYPLPNPATQHQGSKRINRLPAAERKCLTETKAKFSLMKKINHERRKTVCLIIPGNNQIPFGVNADLTKQ